MLLKNRQKPGKIFVQEFIFGKVVAGFNITADASSKLAGFSKVASFKVSDINVAGFSQSFTE